MAVHTQATQAAFINENWLKEVLVDEQGYMVASERVWKKTKAQVGKGDIFHIPIVAAYDAVTISTSTWAYTPTANTETDRTITVDKFYANPVTIPKATLNALSQYTEAEFKQAYGNALIQGLQKQVETNILANFSSFSLSDVGDVTSPVSDTGIRNAWQTLMDGNVPLDDLSFIITPTMLNIMMDVPKYYDASVRGNGESVVSKGIGPKGKTSLSVYGVPVFVSQFLAASGAGKSAGLFRKDAVGCIMQDEADLYVVDLEPAGTDAINLVAKRYYGTGVARADHGVEFLVNA